MAASRKQGWLVPVLVVLIAGSVVADMARRAFSRPERPAASAARPTEAAPRRRSAPRQDNPLTSTAQSGRTEPAGGVEAARRERIRQRIRDESARTYLPETLSQTDSMLRRWPDDRIARPLRVAITRQNVRGFREGFVANVAWAISRWDGVLPVGVTSAGDTSGADIVVTWVASLDSNRTGRTDLTWDRRGNIHAATIVLATHTPEGQLLDARRMSALALHELGHALGLGHSPSRADALFPIAMASELSERDRRTAQLLYDLPPGSIR